jgi:hypothetical protein
MDVDKDECDFELEGCIETIGDKMVNKRGLFT